MIHTHTLRGNTPVADNGSGCIYINIYTILFIYILILYIYIYILIIYMYIYICVCVRIYMTYILYIHTIYTQYRSPVRLGTGRFIRSTRVLKRRRGADRNPLESGARASFKKTPRSAPTTHRAGGKRSARAHPLRQASSFPLAANSRWEGRRSSASPARLTSTPSLT